MEIDEPLTLVQAMAFYPRGTHSSTVIRHITRGIKTRGGVVKLEATRMGARWITTRAALERFRDSLTIQAGATPPPLSQSEAHKKAMAHLKSIGL